MPCDTQPNGSHALFRTYTWWCFKNQHVRCRSKDVTEQQHGGDVIRDSWKQILASIFVVSLLLSLQDPFRYTDARHTVASVMGTRCLLE